MSKSTKSNKSNTGKKPIVFPDTNLDNLPFSNNPFSQTQYNQYSQPQFQQSQYPNQFQNQYSSSNQNMSFSNIPTQFNQYSQPQFSPPPFSQYSSHQGPQYQNQYHSPTPNLNEEEEATDVDADEVGITPRGRVIMFTQAEDILLAQAYVRISENPMYGTDQKFAVFWDKITTEWNQTAAETSLPRRGKKSLTNRFTRMRTEMVMYNEAIHFVDSNYHTGINEVGHLNMVAERFKLINKKFKHRPFSFAHVVEILNRSSKFNYSTTRNKVAGNEYDSTDSNDEEDASGHASTTQPRSGDKRTRTTSQDVSSPSRPMGTKAAKKAENLKKKGKGVMEQEEASHEMLEAIKLGRKERVEYKMQAQLQRQQALEENRQMQQRMLALKEKQITLENAAKIKDQELQIMAMDPNTLPTEEAKIQLGELKSQIMAKWMKNG